MYYETDKNPKARLIRSMWAYVGSPATIIAPFGETDVNIEYVPAKHTAWLNFGGRLASVDADSQDVIDAVYQELAQQCRLRLQEEMYRKFAEDELGFVP